LIDYYLNLFGIITFFLKFNGGGLTV